jgi:hypothetical protein
LGSFVALILLGTCSALIGGDDGGTSSASLTDSVAVTSSASVEGTGTKDAYIAMLDRELASLKTFTGDEYRGSKDAIQLELVLFGAWAETLNKAKEHDLSPAEKEKVARFRRGVSAIQERELPRMRAAWVKLVRDAMWEHNMDVRAGGETGRTLRLTSAIFASNSNIKQVQETVREQAMLLRFRRIEYRWYKGADEYTYFTMDPPADGAVRRITEYGFAAD